MHDQTNHNPRNPNRVCCNCGRLYDPMTEGFVTCKNCTIEAELQTRRSQRLMFVETLPALKDSPKEFLGAMKEIRDMSKKIRELENALDS